MNPNELPQPPEGNPQPPAGYPPPSVPSGYPSPGSYQPPPGYPPPGSYQPPPGYAAQGYGAPGYGAQGGYPPPAGYRLPPQLPPLLQPVAPASGTLWQAWVRVATRPTRENFAAWSQITNQRVVASSIAMALGTLAVFTTITGFIIALLVLNLAAVSDNQPPPTSVVLGVVAVGTLIFLPLFSLPQMFVIPFGQALFMSSSFGTLGQRYQRALRPWALAQVGIYFANSLYFLIVAGVALAFILPQVQANNMDPNAIFGSVAGAFGIIFLIAIPNAVYGITMQVQSGSVGTGMSRWAVFGINLLTNFVYGFGLNIILQIIGAIIVSIVARH